MHTGVSGTQVSAASCVARLIILYVHFTKFFAFSCKFPAALLWRNDSRYFLQSDKERPQENSITFPLVDIVPFSITLRLFTPL